LIPTVYAIKTLPTSARGSSTVSSLFTQTIPENNYRVSDAELDDYRDSRSPKAARNLYLRKAAREL